MKDVQYRKLAKFLLNKLVSLAKEQGDKIAVGKNLTYIIDGFQLEILTPYLVF